MAFVSTPAAPSDGPIFPDFEFPLLNTPRLLIAATLWLAAFVPVEETAQKVPRVPLNPGAPEAGALVTTAQGELWTYVTFSPSSDAAPWSF